MELYKIKQRLKKWWRAKFPRAVIEKKKSVPAVNAPVVFGPAHGIQKRPSPIRRCLVTQKFMFTREQADKKKARILKIKKASYLRVYLCQFCGKWHLTHKKDLMKVR